MSGLLSPGFADPVADAQRCFRAVLGAMAHPGQVQQVAGVEPPPPLCVAAGAALLTLVDHETPVWLDPAAGAARDWIAFHCGSPFVNASHADFALALTLPDPAALRVGVHEEPETSATVILQVGSLNTGPRYRLSGPGLRAPAILRVEGLPPGFVALWQRNRALFPCGVDLILCAVDRLAALPRTVTVEEA